MAVFDILKSVATTLREADKIEQYQQILEVQEKLLEMEKRIYDLEREKRELQEQIEINDGLVFERDTYWLIKEDTKEGPFCTKCKDVDNKLVRMREGDYVFGWALCPSCNNTAPK